MNNVFLPKIGNKVQSWVDSRNIVHVVYFNREPYRLGCKGTQMWGYTPKLAMIDDITCSDCHIEMDSGV